FAVPPLQRLLEKGYKVAGVVTQPDKPSGRGQTLTPSPVKQKAFEFHLPIYQPKSLKDDDAHALFEALAPQMIIVVAYGKILPSWLLEGRIRSEEHTSELQSRFDLVCRLLLEKKNNKIQKNN